MRKIGTWIKVVRIDHYGLCGRDPHPDDDLIGLVGRIVSKYNLKEEGGIGYTYEVWFPSVNKVFPMAQWEIKTAKPPIRGISLLKNKNILYE